MRTNGKKSACFRAASESQEEGRWGASQTEAEWELINGHQDKVRPQDKGPNSYLELVQAFPLASIKSEEHLAAAQQVMDRLLAKEDLDE